MAWVNGKWIEEDDSVASNLTGLLGSNSDYIKQARAQGEKAASKRGLMNSSIAAGSGQSAAIAAALPIASQDASTAAGKNTAQAGYESQVKLNDQTLAGQKELNTQTIAGQKELADLNNAAESARQKEQQGFQLTTQERDIVAQSDRQKEQIAASDRQALLSSETSLKAAQINSADNLASGYLQAISNLSSNTKMKAADRAAYIAEMQRVTQTSAALRDSMATIDVSW